MKLPASGKRLASAEVVTLPVSLPPLIFAAEAAAVPLLGGPGFVDGLVPAHRLRRVS